MEVDRLTEEIVARAKPDPARDVWIMERRLSGFGLRVYPSGRKAYVLVYRRGRAKPKLVLGEPGKPWRLDPTTGAPRVLTPELAREEAIRLLGSMVDGKDPAALRGVASSIPTLAEFATRYLEDHAGKHKAPAAAQADRLNLWNHVLPVLGAVRLDRITTGDVVRLHGSMSDTPVAANRCVALLSTILSKATLWGVLPAAHPNPCGGRRVSRYEEGRTERFLQPDELARVGLALAGQLPLVGVEPEAPMARAAIALLMLTGARPGEIAGLRHEWVNRQAGVAVIPRSKTSKRTGRPRVIVLNPAAMAIYEAIAVVPRNPYVIVSPRLPGRHLSIFALDAAWERVRAAAGVEDVRLMDLRHTFASVAASGGETLMMIGAILGHTSAATTMRYAHLVGAPVRAGSERVAGVIAEALKPKG